MCESNAFVEKAGGEELLLADVARIEPIEGGYRLIGLLGEEMVVMGKIRDINLLKHKILFTAEG